MEKNVKKRRESGPRLLTDFETPLTSAYLESEKCGESGRENRKRGEDSYDMCQKSKCLH